MSAHSQLPDPVTQAAFYADVPFKRLLAYFIDVIIIYALAITISLATFGLLFFVFFAIVAITGFLYRVITLNAASATWGMRIMAIELRTRYGTRFDVAHALLHTVGTLVSMAVTPLQLISVILMLISARGQGVTDHLLGTAMVNARAAA